MKTPKPRIVNRLGLAMVLLVIAGAIDAAGTGSRAAPTCRPNKGEVAVFAADGQCAVLRAGTYRTTAEAGLGDKPIASIKRGSFARAVVCGLDDRFEVECEDSAMFIDSRRRSERPWTFAQVASRPRELECRPNDSEIAIFAASQPIGPCIRLAAGTYDTAEKIGLVRLPRLDFISERREAAKGLRHAGTLLVAGADLHIRVGAGVQAKLCERENLGERCESLKPRRNSRFRLGSVRVLVYCQPTSTQVALFTEPNALGHCTVREIGEYPTAALLLVEGLPSASMRLGSGVEARACSDEKFAGECVDAKGGAIIDGKKKSLVIRSQKNEATS